MDRLFARSHVRTARVAGGLVCWIMLLGACAQSPAAAPTSAAPSPALPTAAASTAPPTVAASRAPTPPSTAEPAQTATTPEPSAALISGPLVTRTRELAPLAPLRDTRIVDRPLANVRALTDSARHYRFAVWDPASDWIAVTPQDGPGLDAINAATGEVRTVVSDTYVLEPVWLAPATLAVHEVAATGDQIARYDLDAGTSEVGAARATQLRAVGAAAETLSFVTAEGRLQVVTPGGLPWDLEIDALVTAPGPDGTRVALTPWTENLEQVQTVLAQPEPDGVTLAPLSAPGEGLWLPRWAPDGAKLALTAIGGRVVTTAADGSARHDLGPGDSPAWSPDGERVAFAGTSAGKEWTSRDIHVVDWQGTGPRVRLTDAGPEQFYISPTWAPDGRRIAFVEVDSGQVFVGDAPQP